MVRVGPPLQLRQLSDRWGYFIDQYEVTCYGYVTEDMWGKLQDFQTFPKCEGPQVGLSPFMLKDWMDTPVYKEIQRKLRLSNMRMSWEFNALVGFGKEEGGEYQDFVRMIAGFGAYNGGYFQPDIIVRWSWFDAFVKLPVYKAICGALNKVLRACGKLASGY